MGQGTASNGLMKVLDIASGKCLFQVNLGIVDKHVQCQRVSAISADDRLVLSRCLSQVYVWSIDTGQRLHILWHEWEVLSVGFSKDCAQIVSVAGRFDHVQR